MIHPILVIALMCVAVFILLRITMRTPVVAGFIESFVSGSLITSTTECPAGYTMYMYNGGAYCCKGRVNGDASKLERTCVAASMESNTLCSLGPSEGEIPNCARIQKIVRKEQGKNICPPSMPNFCKDPSVSQSTGSCCTSAVNEAGTACVNPRGSCSVGAGENEFLEPAGCQFLRLMETDSTCPLGYHKVLSSVNNIQNPLNGLTLYGCSNLSSNCYTEKLIQRMRALGYDVSQLVQC